MTAHPMLVTVDPLKPAKGQAGLMNRWHPDIPAFATVKQGEVFKLGCHEWTGGQVKNSDDADDIRDVDLSQIHFLSGPVAVEGAEPGDALVVEILNIEYYEEMPWGYTGAFYSLPRYSVLRRSRRTASCREERPERRAAPSSGTTARAAEHAFFSETGR